MTNRFNKWMCLASACHSTGNWELEFAQREYKDMFDKNLNGWSEFWWNIWCLCPVSNDLVGYCRTGQCLCVCLMLFPSRAISCFFLWHLISHAPVSTGHVLLQSNITRYCSTILAGWTDWLGATNKFMTQVYLHYRLPGWIQGWSHFLFAFRFQRSTLGSAAVDVFCLQNGIAF